MKALRQLVLATLAVLSIAQAATAQSVGGISPRAFGWKGYKAPVANQELLPTGVEDGAFCVTLDTHTGWIYDSTGSAWVEAGVLTSSDPGPAGPSGADGNGVLSGTGAPSNGLGRNGDFYINTTAHSIYGPKASGSWGSATSLVGPTGSAGATGATGPSGSNGSDGAPGTNGATWLTGSAAPSSGAGANGDFYFRTNGDVYGKSASSWSVLASLVGPAGATGSTGAQGSQGTTGATGAQGSTGATGATGPQGPQGTTGAAGATGAQGPTGAIGPAGADGNPRDIADEGTTLTQRTKLNMAGAGVTCVDNVGASRTDCTIPGGIGGSTGSTDRAVQIANGTGGATIQSSSVTIGASSGLCVPGVDIKVGKDSSGCGNSFIWLRGATGDIYVQRDANIGISSDPNNAGNGGDTYMGRQAAGVMKFTNAIRLTPISTAPLTCGSTTRGTSYYDSDDGDFCDCVGSGWRSRGGSGACS